MLVPQPKSNQRTTLSRPKIRAAHALQLARGTLRSTRIRRLFTVRTKADCMTASNVAMKLSSAGVVPPFKKTFACTRSSNAISSFVCLQQITGTCVQYPGLRGSGALGDASTPGTAAGSIAASAHEGTYSRIAVAGRTRGEERGAAAATAATAARREGPSLRRAAHPRTAGEATDAAHGRAGGTDCRATGRL